MATDPLIYQLVNDGILSPLRSYFITRNMTALDGNTFLKAEQPSMFHFVLSAPKQEVEGKILTTKKPNNSGVLILNELNESEPRPLYKEKRVERNIPIYSKSHNPRKHLSRNNFMNPSDNTMTEIEGKKETISDKLTRTPRFKETQLSLKSAKAFNAKSGDILQKQAIIRAILKSLHQVNALKAGFDVIPQTTKSPRTTFATSAVPEAEFPVTTILPVNGNLNVTKIFQQDFKHSKTNRNNYFEISHGQPDEFQLSNETLNISDKDFKITGNNTHNTTRQIINKIPVKNLDQHSTEERKLLNKSISPLYATVNDTAKHSNDTETFLYIQTGTVNNVNEGIAIQAMTDKTSRSTGFLTVKANNTILSESIKQVGTRVERIDMGHLSLLDSQRRITTAPTVSTSPSTHIPFFNDAIKTIQPLFQTNHTSIDTLPLSKLAFTIPATIDNRHNVPHSDTWPPTQPTTHKQTWTHESPTPSWSQTPQSKVNFTWQEHTQTSTVPADSMPTSDHYVNSAAWISQSEFTTKAQNETILDTVVTEVPKMGIKVPLKNHGGNYMINAWLDKHAHVFGNTGAAITYENTTAETTTALYNKILNEVEELARRNPLNPNENLTTTLQPHRQNYFRNGLSDLTQTLMKTPDANLVRFERLLLMKTLAGLVRTMGMLQKFIIETRSTSKPIGTQTLPMSSMTQTTVLTDTSANIPPSTKKAQKTQTPTFYAPVSTTALPAPTTATPVPTTTIPSTAAPISTTTTSVPTTAAPVTTTTATYYEETTPTVPIVTDEVTYPPTYPTTPEIPVTYVASTNGETFSPPKPPTPYLPTYDFSEQQSNTYNELQNSVKANDLTKSSFIQTTSEKSAGPMPSTNEIAHIKEIPSANERWAQAIAFVRRYVAAIADVARREKLAAAPSIVSEAAPSSDHPPPPPIPTNSVTQLSDLSQTQVTKNKDLTSINRVLFTKSSLTTSGTSSSLSPTIQSTSLEGVFSTKPRIHIFENFSSRGPTSVSQSVETKSDPALTSSVSPTVGISPDQGTTAPPDPTEHQINMAIVGINNAKTEAAAAAAAATIYSPALDMSDNVKQALENKIRQLRTPAGWPHPIPPPLPFGFDVMHIIMNSYYGGPVTAAPMVANPALPALARQNQGPPTSIRRGPSPGKRRQQQLSSQNAVNTWDSGAGTGVPQHGGVGQTSTQQQQQQQQNAGIDWAQLVNLYPGLFDPFHFNHLNTNPGLFW